MAKPTKKAAVAAEGAVEETKSLSFEDGIVLSTTVVLLLAVVLAYMQYSSFYGA